MGGGGSTQRTTTTSELPPELRPLAATYAQRATRFGNTPFQPFTGQRFEPLNPVQQTALGLGTSRALEGSPLYGTAEGALGSLLGGQVSPYQSQLASFADPNSPYQQQLSQFIEQQDPSKNPYLNQQFDVAAERITDAYRRGTAAQTDAAAAQSGAYGGSAYREQTEANQRALGDTLESLAAQLYGGAYESGQGRTLQALQSAQNLGLSGLGAAQGAFEGTAGRQLSALGAVPTISQLPYQDISQLLGYGQILQDQSQQQLDFDYEQYLRAQEDPYRKLAAQAGVFGTDLGRTQTSETTGGGGK